MNPFYIAFTARPSSSVPADMKDHYAAETLPYIIANLSTQAFESVAEV